MPRPLPFEYGVLRLPESGLSGSDRRTIELRPARVVSPFLFLVWGVKPSSVLHAITVNRENQLLGSVPLSVFLAPVEFEAFERLLLERLDGHPALERLDPIDSVFRIDLPWIAPGDALTVELEGPLAHAVFVGRMLRMGLPRLVTG